jgi:hypothetical protein
VILSLFTLLVLALAGDSDGWVGFTPCQPYVQGPLELDVHEGTAAYTFDGLGLTFGQTTVAAGTCDPSRPRCSIDVFAEAALPRGFRAYLNLGTSWPGLVIEEIPPGLTVWPFEPGCGKHTHIQAYVFDGPPELLTTHLVAMEQMVCGCGSCDQ